MSLQFDVNIKKLQNYDHVSAGGFSYSIGGNITFIKNEVENSPYTVIPSGSATGSGLSSATINGYINGEPIGTFFLKEHKCSGAPI